MPKLFDEIVIAGKTAKNRVVMPPMVNFEWGVQDGMALKRHADHYEARAEAGTGTVILEAACILPTGRLSEDQLGMWDDKHIPGLRAIAEGIARHGALALIQVHHAGVRSVGSPYKAVSEYSAGELRGIADAFIAAVRRAYEAGYDGVELHGAHGYLLSQMTSPAFNDRTDAYGGGFPGRMKLYEEILNGLGGLPKDFIIGCRMPGSDPGMEEGAAIARALEDMGVNLLHVSSGISPMPKAPEGFPYGERVYLASHIKRAARVPVIAVGNLNRDGAAARVVEEGVADMAAVGRAMLVDPLWTRNAREGISDKQCLDCKRCNYHKPVKPCPADTVR